ncbi:MAG: phenylacetate--CoA ligase [Victivallaceae bacterium]|nr:phenylacetate--CoA ligase [Victivallaceae bacterium]
MNRLTGIEDLASPDYLVVERLRALQLERLRRIVRHAYENVELFRNRMKERGLAPDCIKTLADLARLPFMKKADLRDTYPFGLFAVPLPDIVRLHASSGTTGKPIVVAYTQEDINVWIGVLRRAFNCCGLSRTDIIQNAYGYGLFTGGLGTHYGAEALGATVVPAGGGNTKRQVMLIRDFGVTAVCCTPSYFIHMIEVAEKEGMPLPEQKLRVGVFGAEPWSEEMRRYIQEKAGIEAFDIYGLSEIIGPGVGVECSEHAGLHIFEDYFYPEIIDPDTEEILPDGETGELVLTTLGKFAMPMIRYRTRDITRILPGECPGGRTLRRIDRISSRSDDMFIIRGVNVFPSQIESALLQVVGAPNYNIILYTENKVDNIEVDVEVGVETFSDQIREMEALRRRISASIESVIGLRVLVKLVGPRQIERSEGKAKRVFDRREK